MILICNRMLASYAVVGTTTGDYQAVGEIEGFLASLPSSNARLAANKGQEIDLAAGEKLDARGVLVDVHLSAEAGFSEGVNQGNGLIVRCHREV